LVLWARVHIPVPAPAVTLAEWPKRKFGHLQLRHGCRDANNSWYLHQCGCHVTEEQTPAEKYQPATRASDVCPIYSSRQHRIDTVLCTTHMSCYSIPAESSPENVSSNTEGVHGVLVPLELLALAGYANVVFLCHGIQGKAAQQYQLVSKLFRRCNNHMQC
jgi:hypothetical protein